MNLKNNKGVTGVDVAVATVILILFVSLVSALFYNLASTTKKIERKSTATNIAIEVIEALKVTNFADLSAHEVVEEEVTSADLNLLTGKDIEIPNGYTVKITIKNPEKDGAEDLTMGEVVKVVASEVSYSSGKKTETVKIETLVKNIT